MHTDAAKRSPNSWSQPVQGLDVAPEFALTENYHRYFDVVPADTQDLLDEAFRLRYQVYCVEHRFEKAVEHPDGREIDRYDAHAVHSLLLHRPTHSVIGTVRLILPTGEPLPITEVCQDAALEAGSLFPLATTAEISRFAISKTFRRRVEDQRGIDASFVDQATISYHINRRSIPHIALGLMKAIVQMSARHGVTHFCAVMDPALLRLLSRFGIIFQSLGPPVDYHGRRQPCHGELARMLDGLRAERPDVWELVAAQGERGR